MKNAIIILLSALLLTLIMPSTGLVNIEASISQEWKEESVIAPFDVPILKSQELFNKESEELRNYQKPVFNSLSNIQNEKVSQMREVFFKIDGVDSLTVESLSGTLSELYSVGIVSNNNAANYKGRAIYLSKAGSDTLSTHFMGGYYSVENATSILLNTAKVLRDAIQPYVVPNITYNERLSQEIQHNALENISATLGIIHAGENIVSKGQIVDENTLRAINSYNVEADARLKYSSTKYLLFFARFLVIFGVLIINYLFFTRFSANYFGVDNKSMLFILLLYMLAAGMVALVSRLDNVGIYIVPLPFVALYLLTLFNMRVAIMGNMSIALVCSLYVGSPFEYMIINMLSGLVCIFIMRQFYQRSMLMRALGAIIVTQIVLCCSFTLLREGGMSSSSYLSLLWIVLGGVIFLGLYQLLYLVENLFGLVSDVTLLELCDTNSAMLLELAQNAPGTFQHSVQVANLAESAAKEIGANPLLARTGALYHDIGKTLNPFYFVENLSGTFNPHNDVNAPQSAQIIRNHVTDGMAIAKKNGLPKIVQDFIEQHHGDSLIFYFYDKARKAAAEGEEVLEADYRYGGPRPVSKEVSICMMADAVEAASRSLPSYEKEPLEALVDKIIDTQIRERQFEYSELTFAEISRVKDVFKAKLNNIYHGRIAYPSRG